MQDKGARLMVCLVMVMAAVIEAAAVAGILFLGGR